MRSLVAALLAVVAAGCISYSAGPTTAPTVAPTPTDILVPVVTAPPLPTAEPGASPTFDVHRFLGASITIFNLSDSDLSVTAVLHDPSEGGEDIPVGDFVLAPGQSTTRSVIAVDEVVPYAIEFAYPAESGALGGTCTLGVLTGDDFTFVAVNQGLTIHRTGDNPATEDELFIDSSSLCQPAPAATP